MIDDHLALPFDTEVLGVTVSVERIDLTIASEIVAICRRGSRRQSIPILDLPLPKPPPAGAEWIEVIPPVGEGRLKQRCGQSAKLILSALSTWAMVAGRN